ncbi:unnamed protein product [Closterium sp. Naga37s-1]|nr:unnamed protein product [Closterium sp. Naga37s-1]
MAFTPSWACRCASFPAGAPLTLLSPSPRSRPLSSLSLSLLSPSPCSRPLHALALSYPPPHFRKVDSVLSPLKARPVAASGQHSLPLPVPTSISVLISLLHFNSQIFKANAIPSTVILLSIHSAYHSFPAPFPSHIPLLLPSPPLSVLISLLHFNSQIFKANAIPSTVILLSIHSAYHSFPAPFPSHIPLLLPSPPLSVLISLLHFNSQIFKANAIPSTVILLSIHSAYHSFPAPFPSHIPLPLLSPPLSVLISLLHFSSQLFESHDIPSTGIFAILALCAHANWFAFDRTLPGYLLALFVAVGAPASEVLIMK